MIVVRSAIYATSFSPASEARSSRVNLSSQSFSDYFRSCERLINGLGKDRRVDDLAPADFEKYRQKLAKEYGIVTLKNEINRALIMFKYAYDQRLIDRPVHYGQSFDKPSAKMLRRARNEAGPKLFEADEMRRIIHGADEIMRAMVLLAANGGLGNGDLANLAKSRIDFGSGWLDYPRPKTETHRRIPLWPTTLAAVQTAIAQRPAATSEDDADMCFLTVQGNRWVRTQPSKSHPGKVCHGQYRRPSFQGTTQRTEDRSPEGPGFLHDSTCLSNGRRRNR